jgi:hypothetical protein
MDQSERRTADSRLTTSKRTVSVMFSATGLFLSFKIRRGKEDFEILGGLDQIPFHAY